MSTAREQFARQFASNANSLPYYESFAEHRRRQTQWALPPANDGDAERPKTLCVLGAGNCFDLDLDALSQSYDRIDLVDIDRPALEGAYQRCTESTQSRLTLHAPLDVTGCTGALERWRAMKASAEELMDVPVRVPAELERNLGGGFDTVLSACLLSQLLLSVRRVLSEHHPLFQAATLVHTLAHLRTIARLTRSRGRGLLVTDTTSNEIARLPSVDPGTDQRPLLEDLAARGQLFQATAPKTLSELCKDDPVLRREVDVSAPLDAWTWELGAERRFLVTALCLTRR